MSGKGVEVEESRLRLCARLEHAGGSRSQVNMLIVAFKQRN